MRALSDFLELERLPAPELRERMREAAAVRNRAWGRTLTYSPKVFIPLTTYCRDDCGYCTFVKRPGTPGARYMSPDEVMAVARRGRAMGCREALFSLGEKPELRYPEARNALAELGYETTIDYLREMCRRVLHETGLLPHANPGTMSVEDLRKLRPVCASMGLMLENASKRLTRPGGPHHACPDKVPLQRLRTLERAGELHIPFTTGILIGIGESWAERIDSLAAINEVHRRHGHVQEVIVQNFRAKPGIPMAHHPEPSHEEMLKTLAAARLLLDEGISLQAPPNLQDAYADYIGAGLNDWGGISPVTIDHINPERAWPQVTDLAEACRARGFLLRERLTIYQNYINNSRLYVDSEMRPFLDAAVEGQGMATA